MKQMLPVVFFLSVLLTAVSCKKDSVKGGGEIANENRPLGAFSSIIANGSTHIVLHVAGHYSATVSGYENLLSVYETHLENGVLTLQFIDEYHVSNSNITVDVYAPSISDIKLNGSGEIHINSGFDGDELSVKINGSGEIRSDANTFKKADLSVNGSGTIEARPLRAENGFATISGSGAISFSVTSYLKASVSGSGTIDYWGDPGTTDVHVSGSGKIRKH